MSTQTRDKIFLLLALILAVYLNACYISGLYYDRDLTVYANDTLGLLKGHFYNAAWSNKPPGINLIFLLSFLLFGKSFIGIQIFSLLANVLSVILLYMLAKYLLSEESRFYFLLPLYFGLFSISGAIQGYTSNIETFLVPFEIAAVLFLGLAVKYKKILFYCFSGLLLGLAFFLKQSALAAFIAGFSFILIIQAREKFLKSVFLFLFSFLAPFALIFVYLLYLGALKNFIAHIFLSTIFGYIKNIATIRGIFLNWSMGQIWQMLKLEVIIFGVLALAGCVYSLLRYKKYQRLLCLLWFVIPAFIISRSGFHLRHHFIEILAPFLTLGIIGLSDIYEKVVLLCGQRKPVLKSISGIAVCILAFPYVHLVSPVIKSNKLANSFFLTQRYINSFDKAKFSRLLLNESPDAARRFLVSRYVKEHTTQEDRIFVWDYAGAGAIYLWTGRDNAINFNNINYFFGRAINSPKDASFIMERFRGRVEGLILRQLARSKPAFIVVVKNALPMPGSALSFQDLYSLEREVFKEFFAYLDYHYVLEKEIGGCLAYRRISKDVE